MPNECPLVNHVRLSYKTYHDESTIECDSKVKIKTIKPLRGIEKQEAPQKVREMAEFNVTIPLRKFEPLQQCFDHRILPKKKVVKVSNTMQTTPIKTK